MEGKKRATSTAERERGGVMVMELQEEVDAWVDDWEV